MLAANEMLLLLPDSELGAEARELASTVRVSGALLLNTVSSFLDHFKTAAVRFFLFLHSSLVFRLELLLFSFFAFPHSPDLRSSLFLSSLSPPPETPRAGGSTRCATA